MSNAAVETVFKLEPSTSLSPKLTVAVEAQRRLFQSVSCLPGQCGRFRSYLVPLITAQPPLPTALQWAFSKFLHLCLRVPSEHKQLFWSIITSQERGVCHWPSPPRRGDRAAGEVRSEGKRGLWGGQTAHYWEQDPQSYSRVRPCMDKNNRET